jgi:hypothetical protein
MDAFPGETGCVVTILRILTHGMCISYVLIVGTEGRCKL